MSEWHDVMNGICFDKRVIQILKKNNNYAKRNN